MTSPSHAPGRRRAVSRHRRTRAVRLPSGWSGFLSAWFPLLVLAAVVAGSAAAWWRIDAHSGPLPAELTLAAFLAMLVLVAVVARRSGLSPLASCVAAAFAATAPPAAAAAGAGVPEHLAVVALLAAVLLLLVRSRRRILVPLAGLLTGVAVAVAPLALAAVPFLAAAALPLVRPRVPALPLAGAACFGAIAAGWLLLGLDVTTAPAGAPTAIAEWLGSHPVGSVAALASVLLGLAHRATRPLAGYAVAMLALSVWPEGDDPVRSTVLLVPALALLVGAAADRAVAVLGRADALPRVAAIAAIVLVAVALGAGAVRTLTATGDAARAAGGPAAVAPGREQRADAGLELLADPGLETRGDARVLLVGGSVDQRIPDVLEGLLADGHEITVAGFPAVAGERDAVRRQVLIAELDGAAVRPGTAGASELTAALTGLGGYLTAESVTATDEGVLVRFPLPAG